MINSLIIPGKLAYKVLLHHLHMYSLPDATTGGIVIQCTRSVSPRNIASGLWYIADYTLQFYRATRFVELVTDRGTMLIDYLHLRHCNKNRFIRDSTHDVF